MVRFVVVYLSWFVMVRVLLMCVLSCRMGLWFLRLLRVATVMAIVLVCMMLLFIMMVLVCVDLRMILVSSLCI